VRFHASGPAEIEGSQSLCSSLVRASRCVSWIIAAQPLLRCRASRQFAIPRHTSSAIGEDIVENRRLSRLTAGGASGSLPTLPRPSPVPREEAIYGPLACRLGVRPVRGLWSSPGFSASDAEAYKAEAGGSVVTLVFSWRNFL